MILPRDRRGVALMLVLWLLVVLGAIALGVGALEREEAAVVANARTRVAARYAAESGIVEAKVRLQRALGAARTPRDQVLVFRGLTDPAVAQPEQPLGNARFQTVFVNLNARVDLNEADDAMLRVFFAQVVGQRAVSALVDALEDWKSPASLGRPHWPETTEYARAGSPFRPTHRPLQSLNELTRIAGFSDSIAGLLAPYITVYSDGRIDVNAAPAPVLAAVPGIGPLRARRLVAERTAGAVFESPGAVSSVLQRAGDPGGGASVMHMTAVPHRLLIVSRGWLAGQPLTHEIRAVFDVDAGLLTLRFWTERDL